MPRVVIIGKGDIGNAIADILRPKKINIEFWDSDPKKSASKPLSEIIPQADFVFLCVPSFAVPNAILEIKPYLSCQPARGEQFMASKAEPNRTIIVSIAKGIERKSGATMDELLHRSIPRFPFALLSGPMLANELSRSMGGAAVVASKDPKTRDAAARLFENTELRVAKSNDIHGVALAGVLKNIYAVVLGAADGMGNGYNVKGFLFGTAQSEIADMIPLLGGERATAGIPALVGDIFATGMSPASNNHAFGAALCSNVRHQKKAAGRRPKTPLFSEGMVSAPFIAKRLGRRASQFPLFEIAVALIKKPEVGREKLQVFLFGKRKK